jgi:hypothetical protein
MLLKRMVVILCGFVVLGIAGLNPLAEGMNLCTVIIEPFQDSWNTHRVAEWGGVFFSKNVFVADGSLNSYRNSWIDNSDVFRPLIWNKEEQIGFSGRLIGTYSVRYPQVFRIHIHGIQRLEFVDNNRSTSFRSHILGLSWSDILDLNSYLISRHHADVERVEPQYSDRDSGAFFVFYQFSLFKSRFSRILSSVGLNAKPLQRMPTNKDAAKSYPHQQKASAVGDPVRYIAVGISLNRDVCGGQFADRYGAFFVFGGLAVGIIFELIALTILWDKRNSRVGWSIAFISLIFWIVAGVTPMVGRLPWDWWKTYDCQQQTKYSQTIQHLALPLDRVI